MKNTEIGNKHKYKYKNKSFSIMSTETVQKQENKKITKM